MASRAALFSILLTICVGILFVGPWAAVQAAPSAAPPLLAVSAPTSVQEQGIGDWYRAHIPARFRARELVSVSLLTDSEMTIYLDGDSQDNSADSSDGDVDGVFQNDPPSITLRLPSMGDVDPMTFAHEYGHYVWFDVLSAADRKRYRAIYARQKAANRLITDYAAESVEEGFAEAFSFYIGRPALLMQRDPLSARFLAQWGNP